jgi:HSP20 family molecular chaperone IbpA
MPPKERNPIRNLKDLDALFEGLIKAALSGENMFNPQGEIRFCTSGSCTNQAGVKFPETIEPELPRKPKPLIDIDRDEKNRELRIIAEIPGFTKEDLKVEVAEGVMKIHAEKDGGRYENEIPLEAELDTKNSKVTYRNGVLEARLKVKEFKKVEGKGLTVE